MMLLRKIVLVVGMMGMGLVLAGCQSDGGATKPAAGVKDQAVMCNKCETVWVRVPMGTRGSKATAYSTRKRMVCPDCKTAVESFFATGKLEHTCKTCGGDLSRCEAH